MHFFLLLVFAYACATIHTSLNYWRDMTRFADGEGVTRAVLCELRQCTYDGCHAFLVHDCSIRVQCCQPFHKIAVSTLGSENKRRRSRCRPSITRERA